MAKIIINTEEARKQLELLAQELAKFKSSGTEPAKKSLKDFDDELKRITKSTADFEKRLKDIDTQMKKNNEAKKKSITAYQKLKAQVKAADDNVKNLTISLGANNVKTEKAAEKARLLRRDLKAVENATKDGAKAIQQTSSKLQQLNTQLTIAKAKHSELALTLGRENAKTREAAKAVNDLKEKIKSATTTEEKAIAVKKRVTKAIQQTSSAYERLKTRASLANQKAKELAATFGVNSRQAKKAAASARKYDAQLKRITASTRGATKGLRGMFGSLKALIGAFGIIGGIQLFVGIIKNVFGLTKTFDSLGFAMEKITKNAFDMAVSQRFLIEITRDFGAELVTTATRWIKFLAAAKQSNVTLLDTENIFRTMTKAAGVLGLKTDELKGVFLALEQMLSKGKVTTEELRRQLGERLPGAMGIMAASLGVTISQLDKMLKKGEVLSAEALPKFAVAVEAAYGIETVEKVDTLVASQNRMTTAWQLFVKNVFTDSNFIRSIFDNLATSANNITRFLSDSFDLELSIIDKKKALNKEQLKEARGQVEKLLGIENLFNDHQEKIDSAAFLITKLNKKVNFKVLLKENVVQDKKELKLLEEQHSLLVKEQLGFNQTVKDLRKLDAFENIKKAKETYEADLKAFEEAQKIKEAIAEKPSLTEKAFNAILGRLGKLTKVFLAKKGIGEFNKSFLELKNNLAASTAEFELFRKQVETPLDKKAGDDDKSKLFLSNQAKIQIEILKQDIETNKQLIAGDKKTWEEKIQLAIANSNKLIAIDALLRSDKFAKIEQDRQKEIDNMKNTGAKLVDINKSFDEKILLALEKGKTKKLQIEGDINDEILKLQKDQIRKTEKALKDKLTVIKFNLKKQLEANKQALDEGSITLKEKQEADLEAIKSTNLEANKLIDETFDKIRVLMIAAGISTEALDAAIARLKGGFVKLGKAIGSVGDAAKAELEALSQIIDATMDAVVAISDVFLALNDRKIEAISAEIDREQEKYDELIRLAEDHYNKEGEFVQGNARQKDLLQQEARINEKKLEKERLKEEQKAAKIGKALAIADIATKLAQTLITIQLAAMAITATPAGALSLGVLGAIFASIQIPLTIGLAAAQTAAVLAAPIPQFKEGGIMQKDGLALINDGDNQEYIERQGRIFTTQAKNVIVPLIAKDKVYKDYEHLSKNSLLMNIFTNGQSLKQREFDTLFDGIQDSIEKGFKKAKINNYIGSPSIDLGEEIWRLKQGS